MPVADRIATADILKARSVKNAVDPTRPYAFLVEPECTAQGLVEDVATIFLTNRECPFRCVFCDLWKNTTNDRVPVGSIPAQIEYALEQLPAARHIKLYNSGNFFDPQAIPREDWPAIARIISSFDTVIVENHPKFCDDQCVRFRDLVGTQLEIAIGLETVHPEILPRLNKQMSLDDFANAVMFLRRHDITVRSFILLRPPWLDEQEGIDWALRSIRTSFDLDIGCCSVIPSRSGNGIMEQLEKSGEFTEPRIESMESVLEAGIGLERGRVFMDLWDAERFADCPRCATQRIDRMQQMNLTQTFLPAGMCDSCQSSTEAST
jgi:radical SAM enzyme (TIGR01210 family)